MRSKSWCMEVLLELRRNILDIICVARRLHVVGLIEALVLRTAGSYRLLTIFKYRHITVIMSARWIGFLAGLISFGIFEHDLVHLGRNPCNSYCICFCPNCAAINPLEDRGNSPISQVTLIRIEKTISSARKKYSWPQRVLYEYLDETRCVCVCVRVCGVKGYILVTVRGLCKGTIMIGL